MKIKYTDKVFWRFFGKKYIKKFISWSLTGILVGIFLLPQIAYPSSITDETIIELTNKERSENGLGKVTANQLLTKAASEKAIAIFREQRFAHNFNDRRFSAWIKEAGYEYSYIGENLAIDFVTSEGVVKAWLASPSHKRNLLNPRFKEVGVAVVDGQFKGINTALIVQIFGAPIIAAQPEQQIPNLSGNSPLSPTAYSLNNELAAFAPYPLEEYSFSNLYFRNRPVIEKLEISTMTPPLNISLIKIGSLQLFQKDKAVLATAFLLSVLIFGTAAMASIPIRHAAGLAYKKKISSAASNNR